MPIALFIRDWGPNRAKSVYAVAKALEMSIADVQAGTGALPLAERELFPRDEIDFAEKFEVLLGELHELSCNWAVYEVPQGAWSRSERYWELTRPRLRNLIEMHRQIGEETAAQIDRELAEGVPLVHAANLPTDLPAITQLFRAYAASLPIDLGYQGFDGELASLPGKYAPPQGALLIARDASGAALGCVAIRPLDEPGVCEMKRLYVAPEGRGKGVGRALALAIIEAAGAARHREIRLDTLAHMHEAQALYRSLGFTEIGAYYEGAPEDTVFMSLRL